MQKYGEWIARNSEWIVRNSEWIAIPFFVRSGIAHNHHTAVAQVPAFAVSYETRLA